VVIGAGLGGLAVAIRLLAAGHDVTVVEKRDQPGGRAYVYRQDGFSFDGGPTVITAPWMIHELFELSGRVSTDYLTMVPVDPFYRIFFDDRRHFDYSGDPVRMEAEIRRLSQYPDHDVTGYREFIALSERIFAKGFTELASVPFLHVTDMLKIAPDLLRLQSYRTVYGLVANHVRDDRLRQVLSFHPLLIGGNPFHTTSIYALIHYLEREWGVWFAMGGTGAIIDAFANLIEQMRGRIELNAEVGEILLDGDRATGVRVTDGREFPADIVVSNGDAAATYQRLLPSSVRRRNSDRHLEKLQYSMSLVVIYFGTDRTYRDAGTGLAHHNIILGPRYKGLLEDIFRRKVLADDFSLYLHMPTLTDPNLARPGGEAFYVLAPVPNLGGAIDWAREAKPFRDRIMAFLERHYLPDLQRHIVTEHMIDPRHFDTDLNSYLGSGFSVEPILTQSAWFRPHNRSEDIANLYLVGAGTHPGAGVPGVLSSARIAADLIADETG
jgi:phytoene desaturase